MVDRRKIGIVGAGGRMGQMLVRVVAETEGCVLAGASEVPGSCHLGADPGVLAGVGDSGLAITDAAATLFVSSDVVIDFTVSDATAAHAVMAAEAGCAFVAGTTGLENVHRAALEVAAAKVPIVWASNMSSGVNLLFALTEQVARALDPDFDIEIVEMHHRHKVDAPSGTALSLGEAAARGRGVDFDTEKVLSREGNTGERSRGNIGFASLRGGDVVGEHSVVFASAGERIELTHRATDRGIFARGAVRAANWTNGKPPGLYSMADVLGLSVG
ncbi:MAG: 4-hydroxy-tetrahydrodipicolinate reductase [Alphaproteobacteria bacterium]|nr:4-hydroxy-tetrahydrodipicolinate reductase [Alphaproteobacteria bacterium]HCP00009.1 4-hydroxy-tetrahydrodipicolinate reductase [Rhodospirillaceae bacterium]